MSELSDAARKGKVKLADVCGGRFTVSSLGGIGGTSFCANYQRSRGGNSGRFQARAKTALSRRRIRAAPNAAVVGCPTSSRVIDGADVARFITFLGSVLGDMRRALL
jgi:pyruvate dehydrogenase E2 component (dihydrolipoamide acetyltransferase)